MARFLRSDKSKKKIMKKVFAVIIISLALFNISASAQTKDKTPVKQQLIDSLKIPDATADSVINIMHESMSQIKNIRNDASLSDDQKKEKGKSIKQEMKTRLQKLLDKDQLAKLQEMEMEMRQSKKNQ